MSMSDPISDMLTRIRNAQAVHKKQVTMPASKIKIAIANVLKEEGYINSVSKNDSKVPDMTIELKYYNNKGVIESMKRESKPSLRNYTTKDDIPEVIGGLGIVIVSTPKGVMTGKNAKTQGVGGEILCSVY